MIRIIRRTNYVKFLINFLWVSQMRFCCNPICLFREKNRVKRLNFSINICLLRFFDENSKKNEYRWKANEKKDSICAWCRCNGKVTKEM